MISGIYPGIEYRGISDLRDIPRYRIQGDTGGYLISGIYPGIGYRGISDLRDIPRYNLTLYLYS